MSEGIPPSHSQSIHGPSQSTSSNNNDGDWDSDLTPSSHSSDHGEDVDEEDVPSLTDSGDEQDSSYNPFTATFTLKVKTPARNIVWREAVSKKTKERVFAAAPAGDRCLVTLVKFPAPPKGEKFPSDIALCHAIEKALAARKHQSLIRTVEWHFGMKAATFNLNSRWNIILLRFDIHPWFDKMGFVFIPVDIEVLEKMLEVANHNVECVEADARIRYNHFRELRRRTYRYRLVKLHMDPSRSISRQQLLPDGTDKPGTRPDWHDYPYEDGVMQNLRSHLNPFYALYHARYQINQAIKQEYIDHDEFWERNDDHPLFYALQLVKQITEQWYDPNTVPDSEFLGTDSPIPSPSKSRFSNNPDLFAEGLAGPSAPPRMGRLTRSSTRSQSSSSSAMLAGGLEDVFSSNQPAASSSSRPPKKPKTSASVEIFSGNERGKAKARVAKVPSDAGTKRTLQQAGLSPSP
ncbi:hypothetical protein BT96DRAFT_1014237 [Gymnopus androsaceus JB14]|uniref:HNH nuclease domain-containing protein n=1 Tax=Gymnopus androsaceus JB14 TaxID=1447944 RepID=A0A6A4I9Z6_9AGAR|nr:hypothetical protein BT96DRAFT_1014237 [Gymnopus androsaceus JB14]